MTFINQLRLGRFTHRSMALILYRRAITWRDDSHLSVFVARGLNILEITRTENDMFKLTYTYRDAHEVEVVLEPQPGTSDHQRFQEWEFSGAAIQFYRTIPGVTGSRAFLYASGATADNQRRPYTGVGRYGATGHPFIVELGYVETCVVRSLTALGVRGKNITIIADRMLAELGKQQRAAEF